jgi:dephospho-CoA kinase
MIIELTGIPGAGKSTVLNSLINSSNKHKYIFDIKKYILRNWIFSINSTIFYDFVLFTKIFLLKRSDIDMLKYIFYIIRNSKNTLFHKINILRNILKKIIIYRFIENKNEIFFIDEGVSHIPFNVFVDINKTLDEKRIYKLLEMIPTVDILLIIDAPDDILIKRVIKRGKKGHKRINFNLQEDIETFMFQSRIILNKIGKYFDVLTYNNIHQEIDINKLIKILGLKDV